MMCEKTVEEERAEMKGGHWKRNIMEHSPFFTFPPLPDKTRVIKGIEKSMPIAWDKMSPEWEEYGEMKVILGTTAIWGVTKRLKILRCIRRHWSLFVSKVALH